MLQIPAPSLEISAYALNYVVSLIFYSFFNRAEADFALIIFDGHCLAGQIDLGSCANSAYRFLYSTDTVAARHSFYI